MNSDFSWKKSAQEYLDMYRMIMNDWFSAFKVKKDSRFSGIFFSVRDFLIVFLLWLFNFFQTGIQRQLVRGRRNIGSCSKFFTAGSVCGNAVKRTVLHNKSAVGGGENIRHGIFDFQTKYKRYLVGNQEKFGEIFTSVFFLSAKTKAKQEGKKKQANRTEGKQEKLKIKNTVALGKIRKQKI